MEAALMGMVQGGLTMGAILSIIQFVLVLFALLWIKNVVTNYSNYRNVISNKRIALGSWVRLPTSTGYSDVRITSLGFNRVLLENEDAVINIPILQFANMTKVILKKSPETVDETEG